MKVLIPMAGMGKRFLAAGYSVPKTLIEIEGAPVVEHVIRHFSPEDDFLFGINHQHERETSLRAVLKSLAPRATIVSMPYEKSGPIATVNRMSHWIQDEEPVIINYCDFSWAWDYPSFKKSVAENNCDGAVVCYRGFHPHLLGPAKYATLAAEGSWMKEIREKYSWHEDKQKDWTSSGTYYFKTGALIKKYFKAIKSREDLLVNGEHYVSQIYQLMKEDGLRIYIYEIPFMLQWGTPEDLEEYRHWSYYFHRKKIATEDPRIYDMQALILMGGAGKRFADAGYKVSKPFISVSGTPMVERSALCLPRARRSIFVTREQQRDPAHEARLQKAFNPSEILSLKNLSEGQAATALAAKSRLDLEKPLLIGACDHELYYDAEKFQRLTAAASGIDALILTYRKNPAVRRNPQAYGWVHAESDGRVKCVSVKQPLSGDPSRHPIVVGSFWFRRARYFTEQAEQMIHEKNSLSGEYYIDSVVNYLIQAGLNVHCFEMDGYASWGTPDDLKTYDYWERYFSKSSPLPIKKKISIVIPAYNEEKNLPDLIQKIQTSVENHQMQTDSEWILVDNGSRDATWDLLAAKSARLSYIKPVKVPVNQGYGHGILEGLKAASGEILAWTHADCQSDPEDIFRAWTVYQNAAAAGTSVLVKGSRCNRKFLEKLFSFGMQVWASLILGIPLHEINAQPKVFSRALYEKIKDPPRDFSLDLYLLCLARQKKVRIDEIPVLFNLRLQGEAKGGGGGSFRNRWRLIRNTVDAIKQLRQRIENQEI